MLQISVHPTGDEHIGFYFLSREAGKQVSPEWRLLKAAGVKEFLSDCG
jgi:hypothetical protein